MPLREDDEIYGELDFEGTLNHLIFKAVTSETETDFTNFVERLEALFDVYKDEKYKNEIQEIEKELEQKLNELNKKDMDREKEIEVNNALRQKFQALIHLAYRRGFIPEKNLPEKEI